MNISNPLALLLCAGGMVIVGSSVSISQLIVDYPHLTGQAARYALAALVLFAIARAAPGFLTGDADPARPQGTGWPTRREWLILTALAGTGLVAFNACILIALPHADPAVVGTFIGASPLGLALLGPLLRGRRPTVRLVAAAGLVVAGTALVQGNGRTDAIGVLASIGALGGEVSFSLLAAAVLPRLGPVRVAAYSCALAVPLSLLVALPAGELARWRLPTVVEGTVLGYLAAFMTVVAFLAWFTGLRRLGVERAGVLVGLMPVATLVTAAVQAGRVPDLGQSAGVLVVAIGLAAGVSASGGAALRRAERSRPRRPGPTRRTPGSPAAGPPRRPAPPPAPGRRSPAGSRRAALRDPAPPTAPASAVPAPTAPPGAGSSPPAPAPAG
ncbi:drug/metabolite transporter (DMT)-like permease [Plantactinospora soyae]|uniref:Drug/metabolite transporter (DMT)-like permease n=1 Tax=Plantactinospora soyae TaxID=1544732 RepID=A0A927R2X6_9ACTN|nr:drug/metabolite transporter (DMT)-like permease [Plantactinospora soyae]